MRSCLASWACTHEGYLGRDQDRRSHYQSAIRASGCIEGAATSSLTGIVLPPGLKVMKLACFCGRRRYVKERRRRGHCEGLNRATRPAWTVSRRSKARIDSQRSWTEKVAPSSQVAPIGELFIVRTRSIGSSRTKRAQDKDRVQRSRRSSWLLEPIAACPIQRSSNQVDQSSMELAWLLANRAHSSQSRSTQSNTIHLHGSRSLPRSDS
ncbi:hypothetical protein O181_042559 [Austropuccinia psidii MF-1]|uniref:Uncharacterized protein n=1 Tax=Austropuccinia psidii MF-1 TaxID=1389203 RepID=A0A9Q3DGN0_9BASI|nr:hypothetical protein [Austropuccinia psidii MF-1]